MRVLALLGAAAATGLLQVGPAATWLPLFRDRLPTLAGRGRPDHVALTFDDGPDPESTPLFLEALAREGVHATFFLLGRYVAELPELSRAVVEAGHEVGVHGWDHRYLLWASPRRLTRELHDAREVIRETTGVRPVWFRPPYGVLTTSGLIAARRVGLHPVLWTAWARDWRPATRPDRVMRTLRPRLTGGATVLLHDTDRMAAPGCWRGTLAALPAIVAQCRSAGWTVGPLRDHIPS